MIWLLVFLMLPVVPFIILELAETIVDYVAGWFDLG